MSLEWEFPIFGLRELCHFDGGEKIHLAFDQSMFLDFLVQVRRKKGKERKKEKKKKLGLEVSRHQG